jgi:hypothetical protein
MPKTKYSTLNLVVGLVISVTFSGVSALVSLQPPLGPPSDLSNYTMPPYPPLPDGWSANATVKNLIGTRLYGWVGCGTSEKQQITGAYDEMHILADQEGVGSDIDWTDQAAKDYWGPSDGNRRYVVSTTTRNQIQREQLLTRQ